MKHLLVLCMCFNICWSALQDQKAILAKSEKKISEYVLEILEHYKLQDPVGIPGVPVPDPLSVPDLAHSFSVGKMNFKNVKLYGLSKFRIDHVIANIEAMKVETALTMKTLHVYGNYTLRTFLSNAHGPFSVNLTNVYAKAIATLEVERSGQLEAQDMSMDITFKGIDMDFQGLGFFAKMFQGVINSIGTFIFDSIKPFVLKEINTNVRKDVNEQVKKIPQRFPNSISPFDQLLVEVRKKIRGSKLDPFQINDYNHSVGIFDVYMRHNWIMGLSSVHRVGDIVFEVKNNTVFVSVEAGTQELEARSLWEVSVMAGLFSRAGSAVFTIDYIKVKVSLSQTMDTRNPPKLEDIQIELGNMQTRFDGAGTIDYFVEFGVNILPNLLRYQIMDALEAPIKQKIQTELDAVNVERLIKDNLDKIDNPSSLSNSNLMDMFVDPMQQRTHDILNSFNTIDRSKH